MKTVLEPEDIYSIAEKIVELLKPQLSLTGTDVKDILDKRELAEYLSVDVSWVDKNIYALPHFKVGKYVRFKRAQVEKWIEGITKTPSPHLKLLKKLR